MGRRWITCARLLKAIRSALVWPDGPPPRRGGAATRTIGVGSWSHGTEARGPVFSFPPSSGPLGFPDGRSPERSMVFVRSMCRGRDAKCISGRGLAGIT